MPPKSSRKRLTVRSPSPSQGQNEDQDEKMEEQVIQPKREKAIKKRGSARQNREEVDEDGAGQMELAIQEPEEQVPTFDRASFTNQPLPREVGKNVANLGADWDRLGDQLGTLMKLCSNAAAGIEDAKQTQTDEVRDDTCFIPLWSVLTVCIADR